MMIAPLCPFRMPYQFVEFVFTTKESLWVCRLQHVTHRLLVATHIFILFEVPPGRCQYACIQGCMRWDLGKRLLV